MTDYSHYTLYMTHTHPARFGQQTIAGHTWDIVWCLETEYGVFVTPEAGMTGLMFFWDEVIEVDVLPT